MPSWFWDQLSSNLSLLNISFDRIRGELPNPLKVPAFADVSMKSNLFEGPLPNLSNGVELLDLSGNRFSGSIPPNIGKVSPYLIFLSLSGNSLSGLIPSSSIGEMQSLQVLDLSNNNLIGPIPTNLYNCSFLKALDLGHNNLNGPIPSSIGSLEPASDASLTAQQNSPKPSLARFETGNNRPRIEHLIGRNSDLGRGEAKAGCAY
ncbi:hypothetical protein QJS10_CPA10g00434 [Acorus calamus]|uniref:Uncharacterized protein n=1 Tax=Acorus calamus TaxID=4465 RepID=A0AAV9DY17_ACOCL|nr:hypothetical protein QJS10_CPA10g00434 [Acorus calamus]